MGKISQVLTGFSLTTVILVSLGVSLGAFVAVTLTTSLSASSGSYGVTELERRAYEINQAVMCPVCPGESIDQSQNPLAVNMRGIVMDRLQKGWTGDQIKAYFVESYGDSVLLSPPTKGFSLLVWVIPPVGIAGTVAVLFMAMRSMRKGRSSGEVLEDVILTDEELAAYTEQIKTALQDTKRGT